MNGHVVAFRGPAPEWVKRLARAVGLSPDQLRWCGCGTFAYAADDYQRAACDRIGFTSRCPDCATGRRRAA